MRAGGRRALMPETLCIGARHCKASQPQEIAIRDIESSSGNRVRGVEIAVADVCISSAGKSGYIIARYRREIVGCVCQPISQFSHTYPLLQMDDLRISAEQKQKMILRAFVRYFLNNFLTTQVYLTTFLASYAYLVNYLFVIIVRVKIIL